MTGTRPPPAGEVAGISDRPIVAINRARKQEKGLRETNNRLITDLTDQTDRQAASGDVAGETPTSVWHSLVAAPLVTATPTLGQPSTKSWNEALRAAWRARKALEAARNNAGAMVLRIVADEDLLDGLAALNWFIGRDRLDPEDVADAIIDGLRKDILGE